MQWELYFIQVIIICTEYQQCPSPGVPLTGEWDLTDAADNTQLGTRERIRDKMEKLSQATFTSVSKVEGAIDGGMAQESDRRVEEADRRAREAERRAREAERGRELAETRQQEAERAAFAREQELEYRAAQAERRLALIEQRYVQEVRERERGRELAETRQQEAKREQVIAETRQQEAEREKEITETRRQEAEREKEIAETRRQEAEREKEIAETRRQEAEREKEIAETRRQEAEREKEIAETRRQEAEREKEIAETKRQESENRRQMERTAIGREQELECRAAQAERRLALIEQRSREYVQEAREAERGKELAETRQQVAEREKEIAEIRCLEAEREKAITETRRQEAEREKEIAESRRQEAEREKEIAETRRQEAEREKELAEIRRQEAEEIAETRRQEAEMENEIAETRRQIGVAAIAREQELEDRAAQAERRLALIEQRSREHEEQLQRLETQWVVERSEIQLTGPELGRGGWATVSVATFRGARVAAKCIHNAIISRHNVQLFRREMDMASRIRHPNLLQFIGATNVGEMVILMELMPTSLRVKLEIEYLPPMLTISIGLDVARALNYLHLMRPHPLIHRDISSSNILLEPLPNSRWKAKVSDYGTVNFLQRLDTICPGNPSYAAPEADNPNQQSTKMDIFSFGALLLEMQTGTESFICEA